MTQVRRASFVVRVVQGRGGQVSGVIERVATGAKEAFSGMEAVGRVITLMLQGAKGATALPPVASDTPTRRREKPRLGKRRGAAPMERGTTDCDQAGLSTSRRR